MSTLRAADAQRTQDQIFSDVKFMLTRKPLCTSTLSLCNMN